MTDPTIPFLQKALVFPPETCAKIAKSQSERWARKHQQQAEWAQACAIDDPLERASALNAHKARWDAIEAELLIAKRRRNSEYQRAYVKARKWRALAMRKAYSEHDNGSPELAAQEAKILAVFDATMRAVTAKLNPPA